MIPHTGPETQAEAIVSVQIILPLDSGNALYGILIPQTACSKGRDYESACLPVSEFPNIANLQTK